MRSLDRVRIPLLLFWLACLLSMGCGATLPPLDSGGEAGASSTTEAENEEAIREESLFHETLGLHKNATVYTGLDTYDVRNVRFNTGQGFGASDALVGFVNNTRFEIKIRFIDRLRVVDRIAPAEARAVPHRFDMIEDKDLDYTFRTELKKTDNERVEFIVRINAIGGELREGGSFDLTGDELQSLRQIVFY
ncbi:MAG: hypothetical protein JW958_13580 [Candidatus Eisenbacteria bacterium]|nr:hypothetical protein [Candidatus Eisenbacteria bacterium]